MVQADGAVGPDEDHQRRPALRVEGEVIRPAGTERGVHGKSCLPQPWPASGRERLVVDQRGLALGDRHRGGAAVRAAGVLRDLAQRRAQGRAVRRIQRAQGAAGTGGSGNDVRRLASFERSHGEDSGVGRVGAPADDLLQRQHDLAQHGHRIDGQVGIAGVAAKAFDDYLEVIGGGVHRARGRPGRAGRKLVLQMNADNRAGLLSPERAGRHYVPSAGGLHLLARLQDGQQRGGQLDRAGGPAQRDRGSEVHVMTAGVHGPGPAGPGHAGLLGDRQGIELSPDGDARACCGADAHQPSGTPDRRRVRAPERRRDPGCRAPLGPGDLGVRMKLVPEPDGVRKLAGQRVMQRRPQPGQAAALRRLLPRGTGRRLLPRAVHAWFRR
jgi:hypothetical protein